MNNNQRIAKNSILLFIRLVITTFIGLYTARLVLLELGVEDYGLYSVVGGIIAMLNFLNTSMIATSYRYIAVEIGKGEKGRPNQIFNSLFVIHIALAVLLIFIGVSLGGWYVKNYLNVPATKIPDALFVLQFSVAATCFSIISVPFQGLITAQEKFGVRVLIEIFRALLRLGLVLWLTFFIGNKLRAYTVIMLIVIVFPIFLSISYCRMKEKQIVKWKLNKEKSDYKNIFGFSAWIMFGAIAHLGVRQGAAIIINLFFGTALNAAFGIASQIYNHVAMFVLNLNQAAVPQIMKSYSSGDSEKSLNLANRIAKLSFFIMWMVTTPLLLSIDGVLELWLKKVPEFTKQFAMLMIINGLVAVLGSGFDAVIQATGQIKKFQAYYSIISLSTLPVAYLLFLSGYPPYMVTVVTIFTTTLILVMRINILVHQTEFEFPEYFFKTIQPVSFVVIFTMPMFLVKLWLVEGMVNSMIISILSILWAGVVIYSVGLTPHEKNITKEIVIRGLSSIKLNLSRQK